MNNQKTAAIVPALNEEGTIQRVVSVLSSSPRIGEVIVISDGSTDKTAAIARQQGRFPGIRRARCHRHGQHRLPGAHPERDDASGPALDRDIGDARPFTLRTVCRDLIRAASLAGRAEPWPRKTKINQSVVGALCAGLVISTHKPHINYRPDGLYK